MNKDLGNVPQLVQMTKERGKETLSDGKSWMTHFTSFANRIQLTKELLSVSIAD